MGGKESKFVGCKKQKILSDKDIKFLIGKTAMTKEQIRILFQKFNKDNPDGKLDRNEFMKLYSTLRGEPISNLAKITNMIFRAYDIDRNGFLTFNEFLIGYALTSKGDLKKKLEYAFELYDLDDNDLLTMNEVKDAVMGMLDLLDTDGKTESDVNAIASEIMKELDTNKDNKISKDEFIDGLSKNFMLRQIMSPFN